MYILTIPMLAIAVSSYVVSVWNKFVALVYYALVLAHARQAPSLFHHMIRHILHKQCALIVEEYWVNNVVQIILT